MPVFSNGQYQGSYINGKWVGYQQEPREELEKLPIYEHFDQAMLDLKVDAQIDCESNDSSYDRCLFDARRELDALSRMKELDCGVLQQKKRCDNEAKRFEILSANIVALASAHQQSQRNDVLMRAENYCMQMAVQYGDASKGLCDAAIDQAVGQVSGKPSAYDLCHAGNTTACEIAIEDMSVSDPRYDEVWGHIHRPYEFH